MARRPVVPIVLSQEPPKVLAEREWLKAIAKYQTNDFSQDHKDYFKEHIMPIINKRPKSDEVFNAVEVVPGVWLGDARDAMDIVALEDNKISCVVNCAEKHTLTYEGYYPDGWSYLGLACDDAANYDILGIHLDEFVAFMDECVANKKNVLVHCVAGINRSATLLIAYMVRRCGMCLKDAIAVCHAKRPIILTNETFVMYLIEKCI
jgi:protein-tyrosine phosphatase